MFFFIFWAIFEEKWFFGQKVKKKYVVLSVL